MFQARKSDAMAPCRRIWKRPPKTAPEYPPGEVLPYSSEVSSEEGRQMSSTVGRAIAAEQDASTYPSRPAEVAPNPDQYPPLNNAMFTNAHNYLPLKKKLFLKTDDLQYKIEYYRRRIHCPPPQSKKESSQIRRILSNSQYVIQNQDLLIIFDPARKMYGKTTFCRSGHHLKSYYSNIFPSHACHENSAQLTVNNSILSKIVPHKSCSRPNIDNYSTVSISFSSGECHKDSSLAFVANSTVSNPIISSDESHGVSTKFTVNNFKFFDVIIFDNNPNPAHCSNKETILGRYKFQDRSKQVQTNSEITRNLIAMCMTLASSYISPLRSKTNLPSLKIRTNLPSSRCKSNASSLRCKSNVFSLRCKSNVFSLRSKSNASSLRCRSNLSSLRCKSNVSYLRCKSNVSLLRYKSNVSSPRCKSSIQYTKSIAPSPAPKTNTSLLLFFLSLATFSSICCLTVPTYEQSFANQPFPQTAVIGSTVVLPCRVVNMVSL